MLSLVVLVLAILPALFYFFIFRPWNLTWGATAEEVNYSMPGDELLPNPSFKGTRAIDILAKPEDIWPWIIQIGYKKAGFYTYDWLDNDGIPSAESVIPEYQDLKIGDNVKTGPINQMKLMNLKPYHSIVLQFQTGFWKNSTWAWRIYEETSSQSRLVSRLRIRYRWKLSNIIYIILVDIGELIMMRKCMIGIKNRVESNRKGSFNI